MTEASQPVTALRSVSFLPKRQVSMTASMDWISTEGP